jgi:methyltransferase family protein
MSGFSADWLALREPFDLRARSPAVLDAVASFFEHQPSVRVIDLASGTGSTLHALSPRLPPRQSWTLVDNDPKLLACAASTPTSRDVTVTVVARDLSDDLEPALTGAVDLVATSALLDLVSDAWLHRVVIAVTARAIPFYAALSYDGRVAFTPSDPFDATVVGAVNAHQLTDKGFGAALGPAAGDVALTRFAALGYAVVQGASDWQMGPEDRDMQNALVDGWARAARDIGTPSGQDIAGWLARRRAAIAAGRSSLLVGHVDFFAVPSATR